MAALRLIFCFSLLFVAAVVLAEAPETDDLSSLTADELAQLEERLKREVTETDASLAALRADTESLRKEQQAIDEEAEKLMGTKTWEAQKKEKRDKELEQAKAEVHAKQSSISATSLRIAELKSQIKTLEGKLVDLAKEKQLTEKRYEEPSLIDVLDSRAVKWGSVPRNIYNKTMRDIVPTFSELSRTADEYRHRVSRTSRGLELLASLLVYGFVIGAVYIVYKMYAKVRGNLTVDRLLFLGDAFCTCFWTVVLICFLFLFDDPLRTIQQRSPVAFFVFQLWAIVSYVSFVLLRVLVLASKMTLLAFGETLAVIIVGQHYYVRVWQPAILDQSFHVTFYYYACYAWLFGALAYSRIEQFSPLKQLRGPKISLLDSLRVLLARFTRRRIPDGDIDNQGQIPVSYGPMFTSERRPDGPIHA